MRHRELVLVYYELGGRTINLNKSNCYFGGEINLRNQHAVLKAHGLV